MAVEKDQPGWLPEPPPPRPARRDAAIDAAMRRFDGLPDEPVPVPARRRWALPRGPQLTVLVSAMLLVVVGIPATLIGLRNEPPPVENAGPVSTRQEPPAPQSSAPVVQPAPTNPTPPATPGSVAPPAPSSERAPIAAKPVENAPPPVADTAPVAPAAPIAAAPPAPPAPPPPPPPPPPASRANEAAQGQSLVVTGSRIRTAPSGQYKSERFGAFAAPRASDGDAMEVSPADQAFLARLQGAVRSDDRRTIVKLIGFPLRVNAAGGARFYNDAKSVERDFALIFTPRVTRAILGQRPDRLFVRDQGVMIGDGEVWFSATCPDAECSPPGPVRITSINP